MQCRKFYSLGRVNRKGFQNESIRTADTDGDAPGQIELLSPSSGRYESWVLNENIDTLPGGPPAGFGRINVQNSNNNSSNAQGIENDFGLHGSSSADFADQERTWNSFRSRIDEFLNSEESKLSVVAVGGASSGKSHTLFGNTFYDQRGLVPRYLEYQFNAELLSMHSVKAHPNGVAVGSGGSSVGSFDSKATKEQQRNNKEVCLQQSAPLYPASVVQMSMYLIRNEQVIDLLDPPQCYDHAGNIAYTDSLGVAIAPLKTFSTTSSAQAIEVLGMGLKVLGSVLANVSELINVSHIVVSFTLFFDHNKSVRRVNFVELAGLFYNRLPTGSSISRAGRRRTCKESTAGGAGNVGVDVGGVDEQAKDAFNGQAISCWSSNVFCNVLQKIKEARVSFGATLGRTALAERQLQQNGIHTTTTTPFPLTTSAVENEGEEREGQKTEVAGETAKSEDDKLTESLSFLVSQSLVTYLLQEMFCIDRTRSCATLMIVCLRGNSACYKENASCLELVSKFEEYLSENDRIGIFLGTSSEGDEDGDSASIEILKPQLASEINPSPVRGLSTHCNRPILLEKAIERCNTEIASLEQIIDAEKLRMRGMIDRKRLQLMVLAQNLVTSSQMAGVSSGSVADGRAGADLAAAEKHSNDKYANKLKNNKKIEICRLKIWHIRRFVRSSLSFYPELEESVGSSKGRAGESLLQKMLKPSLTVDIQQSGAGYKNTSLLSADSPASTAAAAGTSSPSEKKRRQVSFSGVPDGTDSAKTGPISGKNRKNISSAGAAALSSAGHTWAASNVSRCKRVGPRSEEDVYYIMNSAQNFDILRTLSHWLTEYGLPLLVADPPPPPLTLTQGELDAAPSSGTPLDELFREEEVDVEELERQEALERRRRKLRSPGDDGGGRLDSPTNLATVAEEKTREIEILEKIVPPAMPWPTLDAEVDDPAMNRKATTTTSLTATTRSSPVAGAAAVERGSGEGGRERGRERGGVAESFDPYLLMLSPSALSEAYGKIPLKKGYTILRGSSLSLLSKGVTASTHSSVQAALTSSEYAHRTHHGLLSKLQVEAEIVERPQSANYISSVDSAAAAYRDLLKKKEELKYQKYLKTLREQNVVPYPENLMPGAGGLARENEDLENKTTGGWSSSRKDGQKKKNVPDDGLYTVMMNGGLPDKEGDLDIIYAVITQKFDEVKLMPGRWCIEEQRPKRNPIGTKSTATNSGKSARKPGTLGVADANFAKLSINGHAIPDSPAGSSLAFSAAQKSDESAEGELNLDLAAQDGGFVLRDQDFIRIGLTRYIKVCIPKRSAVVMENRFTPASSPARSRPQTTETNYYYNNDNNININNKNKNNAHSASSSISPTHRGGQQRGGIIEKTGNWPESTPKSGKTLQKEGEEEGEQEQEEDDFSINSALLDPVLNPPLTAWEESLALFFEMPILKNTIIYNFLKSKRQVAHLKHVNRELNAILKLRERSRIMRLRDFEPETWELDACLQMIPLFERQRMIEVIACADLAHYFPKSMRFLVDFECFFHFEQAMDSDGQQKEDEPTTAAAGLAVVAGAEITGTDAQKGQISHGKQTNKVVNFEANAAWSGFANNRLPAPSYLQREMSLSNFRILCTEGRDAGAAAAGLRSEDDTAERAGNNHTKQQQQQQQQQQLTLSSSGTSSWWWTYSTFLERYFNFVDLYFNFVSETAFNRDIHALNEATPAAKNPFVSTVDDELIGVAFLNMDSLFHLIDVHDDLSVINYNGDCTGYLRMHVRGWVDKVEPTPPYITADKPITLRACLNKRLILNFYFDSLSDLPTHHCSETHIYFRFYRQLATFKTPRFAGTSTHPYYLHTVQVAETITEDLIDYLCHGALELEVFAKKRPRVENTTNSNSSNNNKIGQYDDQQQQHEDVDVVVNTYTHPLEDLLVGDVSYLKRHDRERVQQEARAKAEEKEFKRLQREAHRSDAGAGADTEDARSSSTDSEDEGDNFSGNADTLQQQFQLGRETKKRAANAAELRHQNEELQAQLEMMAAQLAHANKQLTRTQRVAEKAAQEKRKIKAKFEVDLREKETKINALAAEKNKTEARLGRAEGELEVIKTQLNEFKRGPIKRAISQISRQLSNRSLGSDSGKMEGGGGSSFKVVDGPGTRGALLGNSVDSVSPLSMSRGSSFRSNRSHSNVSLLADEEEDDFVGNGAKKAPAGAQENAVKSAKISKNGKSEVIGGLGKESAQQSAVCVIQ